MIVANLLCRRGPASGANPHTQQLEHRQCIWHGAPEAGTGGCSRWRSTRWQWQRRGWRRGPRDQTSPIGLPSPPRTRAPRPSSGGASSSGGGGGRSRRRSAQSLIFGLPALYCSRVVAIALRVSLFVASSGASSGHQVQVRLLARSWVQNAETQRQPCRALEPCVRPARSAVTVPEGALVFALSGINTNPRDPHQYLR